MLLESGNSPTAEVWASFSADLLRFIKRRVGDDSTADDILQEAFLRIHDKREQLPEGRQLAAYVHTTVRRLIADHYRRQRPSDALADVAEPDPEADNGNGNENELVGAWLMGFIDALPQTYREAVRMAEVDGLKQREVAERLGLSLSAAKSRIQRGREQLRQTLQKCCHVELDRRGNVLEYVPQPGRCDDCS